MNNKIIKPRALSSLAPKLESNKKIPMTSNKPRNLKQKLISIKPVHQLKKFNDQLFQGRKQNHLNTQHNKRKSILRDIIKQNKRLYKRVDSQKSIYSNKQLNKSFCSRSSVSRQSGSRSISQSKVSTSRSICSKKQRLSQKGGRSLMNRKVIKQKNNFVVESQKIDSMKQQHIDIFKTMFFRVNKQNQKKNIKRLIATQLNKTTLPKKQTIVGQPPAFDNFLHCIAQEMYNQKNKEKIKVFF